MADIELPGGLRAVRAEEAPEPTDEAAAAGHEPALAPAEPSAEQLAKGEIS